MLRKNQYLTALWLILFLFIPTTSAHAYLDPGSGSLIIQVLIAGLLGMVAFARIFKDSIMSFLGFKRPQDEVDDEVVDHERIQ